MRATVAMATLAVVHLTGCVPARSPGSPSSVLPLTSVRLYETGVGYFERSGVLSPSERTGLPVPASHLDDALESLVVFTPGHSDPVRGLAFGTSVSRGMARAMAGLPTESETPITYLDLLTSLKGAHVELKTRAGSYLGRLIDIESPKDAAPTQGAPSGSPPSSIVVLTDGAELVRVPMGEVRTVRPTDPAYATRLDAALDALSLHSAQSRKMLDVLGASRGPVTLGYVAETPVWRTTYRLVLDADGRRGELQGWALVHNDTDENWESVKVELVNGRPDSFLFPLAAPRYARRTLVHPDDQLSTVPQLLDKTADAVWGDNIDDAFGSGGLDASGVGEGGGGYGEGIGLGGLGGIGHGSGTASGVGGASESHVLNVGDLARVPQAAGVEAGALFVYALPERLALPAHASVLAPFLMQPVDVESIAWVDQPGQPARSAVRFVNSTSQTLPAGTISFFGDGGFAGESSLDRLKPGERRFVRFGADLDVNVKTLPEKGKPTVDTIERLTYSSGVLYEHFRRTTDTTYVFENRSGHSRAVYLTLHLETNARVTGADDLDFDSSTSIPAAVMHVGAKARVEREIVTVEGLSSNIAVSSDALAKVAASPGLAAADKAIATEALARQGELDATMRDKAQATEGLAAIEKELGRLREDAKALGGERGAATPPELVRRLLAAEDRHALARKRVDGLEVEQKTRSASVRATLARLGA